MNTLNSTVINPAVIKRCLGLSLASLLTGVALTPPPATAQTSATFCRVQETQDTPAPRDISEGDLTQGRSYGDPHMNTFDGFHYGFQTVGEFILAKSSDRTFEVQTRQAQVPNRTNLSLNTAVAMRVCDHRVAFYVQDAPDGSVDALWVDGQAITFNDDNAFALPNGGEIQRQSDTRYTVLWPTGDQVALKLITVSGARFVNILPSVTRDRRGQMVGLLGNFNGNESDDLISRDGTAMPTRSTYSVASNALNRALPAGIPVQELSTAYLEQLNRQFGDSWRISQAESLFDYAPGVTTASFTNRSFPDTFLTLDGVSDEDLAMAVTECEAAGVAEEMMDGCVFDIAATGNTGFANAALNAVANVVVDRATDRLIDELNDISPIPIPRGWGLF
ncbi:MAG: VWD domain-containing protein [Cyanobacteria bacterium J06598_3]